MRYREFVEEIKKDTGLDYNTVDKMLASAIRVFGNAFERGEKKIPFEGLGTFGLRTHPARTRFNPHKNRQEYYPEQKTVRFRPDNRLLHKLNGDL